MTRILVFASGCQRRLPRFLPRCVVTVIVAERKRVHEQPDDVAARAGMQRCFAEGFTEFGESWLTLRAPRS